MRALTWLLLLAALPLSAQTTAHLIIFGSQAEGYQGSDEYTQIIYFSVPGSTEGPLFLRIYDPDCGGARDESFGEWDTRTRFTLAGGEGAYTTEGLRAPTPPRSALAGGKTLAEETFGINRFTDSRWYTLAEFAPEDGEKVGDRRYFRLRVDGLEGNDGNVFDVLLSRDAKLNRQPEGLRILNYSPGVSLPGRAGYFGELRFRIPENTSGLTVRNFDLEHGLATLETPFGPNYRLNSSGDGEWREDTFELAAEQAGDQAAVVLQSYSGRLNNAVIRVSDAKGVSLPIELPVLLFRGNTRPEPVAEVEFLSDCYSVVFDASASRDQENDLLSYFWEFGDGETAEGARVIHRYARAGDYDYQLTVQDDSGRIASRARQRHTLSLNAPPKAEAGPDLITAPGESLNFDASASSDADGELQNYSWDFGDGESAEGVRVTHVYQQPGLYRSRLRVQDNSDSLCNTATDEIDVWVNARPVVKAGADRVVSPGQAVKFDAGQTFDSDGSISRYLWDFGDGESAEGYEVSHAYAEPGEYTVSLTVADDAGVANSRADDWLTVRVNQHPLARPQVAQAVIAVGEDARLSGAQSVDEDGRIVEYSWDFGDGGQGAGMETTHAYHQPGVYTVSLRVRDDSGTSSDSHQDSLQVAVNYPPVAEAGDDQRATASLVFFDAHASRDTDGELIAYNWEFGDGEQGQGEQTQHVYRLPGVYQVTLTVTDDSGTSTRQHSDSLQVIVNHKPVADAGPDRLAMPGEALRFDAGGSLDPDGEVQSYAWHFGDGHESEEKVTTHAYARPGHYTVNLSVKDDSGHANASGHDQAEIVINAQPVALAGADVLAAPGDPINLDGGGSYDPDGEIKRYVWEFSDGETLEGAKISRRFARPGIYTATLKIDDGSGAANAEAKDELILRINHAPLARAGENQQTCDTSLWFDASASSDPDGDELLYTWDFGDGSPPRQGVKVLHHYAEGGNYPVVLTVDDGTGLSNATAIDSLQVSINQAPVAEAGDNRIGCAGELVLFDAGQSSDPEGSRLKYSWDFGDGGQGEGLNPTRLYKKGGLYPVTLTVEDESGLPACNQGRDRFVLRVAEAPVAEAGPDLEACAHELVQFDGGQSRDFDGVVNQYQWDFGDGHGGGGREPGHVYTLPGNYQVTLTITGDRQGQCSNTNSDTLSVKIHAAPKADFLAPAAAPVDQAVSFDAGPSMPAEAPAVGKPDKAAPRLVAYHWDFGDGEQAEGEKVTHTYQQAGNYFVTLKVTSDARGDCNQASLRRAIRINAPPVAEIQAARAAAPHQSVVFDAGQSHDPDGALTGYDWDFGDGHQAKGMRVRHRYDQPGDYPVTLTVRDEAGLDNSEATQVFRLKVNAPPEPELGGDKPVHCPGEAARFNAAASRDPDGEIRAYRWQLGDGQQAEGATVSHVYAAPGIYNLLLEVEDDSGQANQRAQLARRITVNQPPEAWAGPDRRVCPGETLRLDAGRSHDGDGEIQAYYWDFGNGDSAEGARVQHAYPQAGEYELQLRVDDGSGSACATDQDSARIRVNHAPVPKIRLNAEEVFSGGAHDAVLFEAVDSHDADGDPLSYHWDFGDRQTASGARVWHHFARPGRYTVTLRARDDSGTRCAETQTSLKLEVKGR